MSDIEDFSDEEFQHPNFAVVESIRLASNSGISNLNLSGNSLTELPKELSDFADRLEELNISSNDLTALPTPVCQLVKLRVLDVGNVSHRGNKLNCLPLGILKLQELEKIFLNRNAFVDFPVELCHLPKLDEIDLEGNSIRALPTEIRHLERLERLNIAGNKIEQLPDAICELNNLKELFASGNNLKGLPTDISKLKQLQVLDIGHNKALRFPYVILELTNLEILRVNGNNIEKLPSGIGDKLQKLTELSLEKNKLSELPESVCSICDLATLNISNNLISVLPKEFGNSLANLQRFEASCNWISSLPNSFCNLSKLSEFIGDQNSIRRLPNGFFIKLTNLVSLSLKQNPLEHPPREILEMGLESCRAYEMQRCVRSRGDRRPSTSRISRHRFRPPTPQDTGPVGREANTTGRPWSSGARTIARPSTARERPLAHDAELPKKESPRPVPGAAHDAEPGDGNDAVAEMPGHESPPRRTPTPPSRPDDGDDVVYSMGKKPHGLAVIFSNEHFTSNNYPRREGTQVDIDRLTGVFHYLGYKVRVHKDLTLHEMMFHLEDIRCEDHSNYDSFVCCVLSHGKPGVVVTSDCQSLPIQAIQGSFNARLCPPLRGKPKIFIIQACRGARRQSGYEVDAGETEEALPPSSPTSHLGPPSLLARPKTVPEMADFVIGYATIENCVSYRSATDGSIYIEKLADCLQRLAGTNHLLDILTEVNKLVSEVIINEEHGGWLFESRQVPAPVTTLRGKVYFKP
ncbi:protein scribble homolog [Ptychodera flava]|uniref:protein scribble homolog n=1 Tax=Ptychodera flava TaxID=63121 RepID=UPI003969D23A